jgi:RNA polymerase sigma-70 factor (ECF subfamily)
MAKASGTPDPDLPDVRAWADGDHEAGDRLVTKYYDAIYGFFNRKISGDVGDLVQATFEVCTVSVGAFEERSKFRTWLWGIAHNKLLEHFKTSGRAPEPIDPSRTSLADLGVAAPQLLDDRRQARVVLEAMRTIPLDMQIALELFYWEKLTGRALGQVLGVPENTARSRLRRARELLTARIEQLEHDPVRLKTTLTTLDGLIESLRQAAVQRYPRKGRNDASDE